MNKPYLSPGHKEPYRVLWATDELVKFLGLFRVERPCWSLSFGSGQMVRDSIKLLPEGGGMAARLQRAEWGRQHLGTQANSG